MENCKERLDRRNELYGEGWHQERRYVLTSEVRRTFGRDGDVYASEYTATAEDEEGNTYRVRWRFMHLPEEIDLCWMDDLYSVERIGSVEMKTTPEEAQKMDAGSARKGWLVLDGVGIWDEDKQEWH